MPSSQRRLVDRRLDRPVDLRVAEAAEGRRRHRVRQDRPRVDARPRAPLYGPVADVRALAHHAVGDVRVGADQVVGLDVLEADRAVARSRRCGPGSRTRPAARPGTSPRGSATSRTGRPSASAMKTTAGSYLACCLPPNAPPGSGAMTRTLDSGRPRTPASIRCSQYGCWIALQTTIAVAVGRRHVGVGLDGELGDHREGVAVLDDEVGAGLGARRGHPRRRTCSRRTLVWAQRVAGAKRRILDERRVGGERARDGEDRRAAPRARPGPPRAAASAWSVVSGDDERDGVAVVLGLADRDHRPVLVLRPEPRHGLREVVGGQDEADARHREGGGRVDGDDPRPRRQSSGHELGVELVGDGDVGDVRCAR